MSISPSSVSRGVASPAVPPRRAVVPFLLLLPLLAACGSPSSASVSSGSVSSASVSSGSAATDSPASAAITVSDAWVKAAPKGMTAMFGVLHNDTGKPLTVVGASTDLATVVELHETVMVDGAMQMRPKAGGFTVQAGKTFTLAPGGNHVMLMGMTRAVRAGDQVMVTLTFGDGSTVVVSAIGKDFAGAKESYAGTPTSSMAGM
jgi:periplasmic copper chaperone A